jgi:hypothetical protein
MSWFIVRVDRYSNRPTQSTADNGTVTPADLIANCCAGGTANSTTNCRVQSRTGVYLSNRQCRCQQ